ncbi:hypothetical protein D3C71_2018700 [compost metagenome]
MLNARINRRSEQVWTLGESIGLSNVASRIQMHFAAEYGIKVDSELGEWTTVTICIPFTLGGEHG